MAGNDLFLRELARVAGHAASQRFDSALLGNGGGVSSGDQPFRCSSSSGACQGACDDVLDEYTARHADQKNDGVE